jgi:hypothetical protein
VFNTELRKSDSFSLNAFKQAVTNENFLPHLDSTSIPTTRPYPYFSRRESVVKDETEEKMGEGFLFIA